MIRHIQGRLACLIAAGVVLASLSDEARAQSAIVGWGEQVVDSRWNISTRLHSRYVRTSNPDR